VPPPTSAAIEVAALLWQIGGREIDGDALGGHYIVKRSGWLESANYREVEAPFDSCWILDAMIGDGGRTIAGINLTRPRSARPFTVDGALDVPVICRRSF
jgi:hypothetical protein